MTREAQRREVWDKRRGICVMSLLFTIFINEKGVEDEGKKTPELIRKNRSLSFLH